MLYTRKGDDGTTSTFGCNQRLSKSSAIAEALGALDEANSFLGIVKTHKNTKEALAPCGGGCQLEEIIDHMQQNLFIVQAEVAGAPKYISPKAIQEIENSIDAIEKELPPIKSFFVSGGTNLAAQLDFARTLVRRAERRVVVVHEEEIAPIHKESLSYMNRLSSLLYALARHVNFKSNVSEEKPHY